jgi:hypothetical protein
MCTVIGAACRCEFVQGTVLRIVLVCNCALPDDGPGRPETCRSLRVLKYYCDFKEVFAFCWFTL